MKNEELTPLEALKSFLGTRGWYDNEFQQRYDFVEKSLKALEIIKEKLVDMTRLAEAIKRNDLSFYNYSCYELLTQEEYDLLKEVLL